MKNRNSNTMMRKVIDRKIFNNNKLLNNKLINNKITLFIVAALAFFSLYIHITSSRFSAVLLFFLTAALVYSFTNNMTVVLGASFVITTIASVSSGLFGFKEGVDETLKKANKDKTTTEDTTTEEDTTTTPNTEETEDNEEPTELPVTKKTTTQTGKKDNKASFGNQKLSPALFNTPSKKNVEAQLGKASEVEQAYDNLEKIMGTEKISSISSETKDLIKQQNELIKQLKTMTPALNNAMSSLGNLDLNKLTGMFNSATKNLSEIKDT